MAVMWERRRRGSVSPRRRDRTARRSKPKLGTWRTCAFASLRVSLIRCSMEATSTDIAAPSYVNMTEHVTESFDPVDFDTYFGLLANETLVIIRPYTGDDDDKVLEELRPKYVVMYDPDPAFVRRIEVSSPGINETS